MERQRERCKDSSHEEYCAAVCALVCALSIGMLPWASVCAGTVEQTIKVHRSRMISTLGVRNIAERVRLAGRWGWLPNA